MHLLYLVSSTLILQANVYCNSDGVKFRRGGAMGLIAFPRVGRADPRTWLLDKDDPVDGVKFRRGGGMGLIPSPRTGRANSRTWLLDMDDILDHEEQKRLKPFPRVGRTFQPSISKQTLWDELQLAYGNNPDSDPRTYQTLDQSMYPGRLDSLYSLMQEDNGRSEDHVMNEREKQARDNEVYWFAPRSGRSAERLTNPAEYGDDASQELNSAKTGDQPRSENQPDGIERRKRSTTIKTESEN